MAGGVLETQADQVSLGSPVQSAPLCRAIRDLYLGQSPVSRKAKQAAGASMLSLFQGYSPAPPPCTSEKLACNLPLAAQ